MARTIRPMSAARFRRLMASAESKDAALWQQGHEARATGRRLGMCLGIVIRRATVAR